MLTSRFGSGYGMGYSAYKEASAFVARGHVVTVIHCNANVVSFECPGINLQFLPSIKTPIIDFVYLFFSLKKVFKTVNISSFDVVYIQSLEFGLMNLKNINKPIFYFARSTMLGMRKVLDYEDHKLIGLQKLNFNILVWLEKRCLHYSRNVFIKSRLMAKELNQLYDVTLGKMKVISGGVDSNDFVLTKLDVVEQVRKSLRLSNNSIVLLYAGRIVPQQGLIYLVQAVLALLSKHNIELVIAGEATNKAYLNKIISIIDRTSYKNVFHFIGHVNQLEMSKVYSLANCLVMPSLYEPFGMVALQAAFLGKSVITSSVAGVIEVLEKYDNCRVVGQVSVGSLKKAILEFIEEERKNDQGLDLNSLTWEKVAKNMINNFKSI